MGYFSEQVMEHEYDHEHEVEGPTLEDELLAITRPLYDPSPTDKDITYRLVELVKSDGMSAEEVVERLSKLVAEILAIESRAIRLMQSRKGER